MQKKMTNIVDPDKTAPLGAAQSGLGLYCLPNPVLPKI